MPSNNDNSTDQKLGDSVSNSRWGRVQAEKKAEDKGSTPGLDSDEAREPGNKSGLISNDGSGQPFNGGGQENQNEGTNAESGSTRGSSSEQHVETNGKGGKSIHGRSGQLPRGGSQENQNQGTNRETGSTRGGSFEHHAEG